MSDPFFDLDDRDADGAHQPDGEPPAEAPKRWSGPRRFLFWFGLVYFVLYTFPFPISSLPTWVTWKNRLELEVPEDVDKRLKEWDSSIAWVTNKTAKFWNETVTWAAGHFDDVQPSPMATGSGDRSYNFLQDGSRLAMALVVGGLLFLVFRRRMPARSLRFALVVGTRYFAAFSLLTYGFFKVIKSQFSEPSLTRLLQPYGESSPMGLVWTFMGFSDPYNWFTGGAEVLGGALLLFRRTTTLGALVGFGVMANVAMLNYAYDVPVKLYSTHLVVMLLFLILIDLPRLTRVFVTNKSVPQQDLRAPYSNGFTKTVAWILKIAIVTNAVWGNVQASRMMRTARDGRAKPELYGVWDVETFERDGVVLPPLTTDGDRWARLIIDKQTSMKRMAASIETMTGERTAVRVTHEKPELDEASEAPLPDEKEMLKVSTSAKPRRSGEFVIERPEEGELVLTGEFDGSPLVIRFSRRLPEDFLLMNRGFHWISERPFNR